MPDPTIEQHHVPDPHIGGLGLDSRRFFPNRMMTACEKRRGPVDVIHVYEGNHKIQSISRHGRTELIVTKEQWHVAMGVLFLRSGERGHSHKASEDRIIT